MAADTEVATGPAGNAAAPVSTHADSPPVSGPPPDAGGDACAEERVSSNPELGREVSTVGDLPPSDTFKKKKKKRVGGIAFAVQVEEQVIQSNEAEMQHNREHWQAIQEKVNDPNTVSIGCRLWQCECEAAPPSLPR
jgi:hypothetical protein